MSPFRIYHKVKLPSKLDLDKLLQSNDIVVDSYENNPSQIRDRAALILGQIYNSIKAEGGPSENYKEFTPLCGKILAGLVRDYKRYIDFFVDNRVLICNDSYSAKNGQGKCKRYRFYAKYFYEDPWKDYYIYDRAYIERIQSQKRTQKAIQKYAHQYDCLHHLEIDEDEAEEIIQSVYPDSESRNLERLKLAKLKDPKLWTFRTGKTNRLYTPISHLKKEVRNLLTYKGQDLVEVDIVNSIPYFSLLLLKPSLIVNNDNLLEFWLSANPKIVEEYRNTCDTPQEVIESFYEDVRPFESDVAFDRGIDTISHFIDVKEYRELVLSGDLYEYMAVIWSDDDTSYSRSEAKKKLIAMFNSPSTFDSRERRMFKDEFPTVARVFEDLNTGFFKVKRGKGALKWKPGDLICPFAVFTQMVEAWFVLDVVCKAIEISYPQAPLYTIHDSILSISTYIKPISKLMNRESLTFFDMELSLIDN